jgi:hydroxymethylglutaryl-CoA reductase
MAPTNSGFSDLSPSERRDLLKKVAGLTEEEVEALHSPGGLGLEMADRMIENVVGLVSVPIGIASGFLIDGKEYLVPMATEQRSVITMAERGASLVRGSEGFKAESTGSTMIGHIQLMRVQDFEGARKNIMALKEEILRLANTQSRTCIALDVEVRALESTVGPMLIVELLVDVRDSMGANVVDSMLEAVSPLVTSLSGGRANVRVLSNLAIRRMVRVEATAEGDALGSDTVDGIVEASSFAAADPYRAATHNKGIMNGVAVVLMATSNDTRAVEAGAHASLTGGYRPLSTCREDGESNLLGELEMPIQVGIIGGSGSTHSTARIALKILGVKTARELGEVAASTGLACNLAALTALVSEGITSIY